jgi:hypothetical protein
VVVERAAVGVGHHPARLLHHERGGGDVVREVGAHRALPDLEERVLDLRDLVDDAAADVDVRVELSGDEAGQVERGRPEVEVPAAHARAVDELLEDHAHRHDGPRAEAGGPEQRAQVGVRREVERDRRTVGGLGARAMAARGEEARSRLELVHDTERRIAEARVLRRRDHRDRHAARLEPRGSRAGAVDRVDHEEGAGLAVDDEAAVLGVEADVTGRGEPLLDDAFGDLVDGERGVAAGRAPDACARVRGAEQRQRGLPDLARHRERERTEVIHAFRHGQS